MKSKVIAILSVILILGLGFLSYHVFIDVDQEAIANETINLALEENDSIAEEVFIDWEYRGAWISEGSPPECPEPLILETPVDLDLVTSILYPGQIRGNDFKAHGGFRFDNSSREDIVFKAPLDGYLVAGTRYLHDGEVQYMFDFVSSCGIKYRVDHLVDLSLKLEDVGETLPEPKELDSRTTVIGPIEIESGEVLATSVGFEDNVFVDLGVYDLRNKNEASQDLEWEEQYGGEQASYALCWLDLLNEKDANIVKALPGADGVNGKNSDYC